MIYQEGGHWYSTPTNEEALQDISDILSKLSPEERVALEALMGEYKVSKHSRIAETVADNQWEEVPLPIDQWLDSYEHIGDTGSTIFPVLKKDIIEIFSGDYHEVIFTGSTGYGKDYTATICLLRLLYELCCLRDPSRSLGLGAGEPIHIAPISRTAKLAQQVVLGGIEKKLAIAPWFKGRFKATMEYIDFVGKRIRIISGAASDSNLLGLNIYAAIVDELNFYGDIKQSQRSVSASGHAEDKAQSIYDALVRRVKSRFQRSAAKGMIFLLSSKRSTDDFTERRIREHIKNETTAGVFVRDYCTWMVKPEPFANQKWYRCAVLATEGRCKVLEDSEPDPEGALVFKFPEDYLPQFLSDPAGSARDVGGIATDAVAPYFTNREAIEEMFDPELPHLFDVREWEMGRPLGINWKQVMTVNANGDPVPWCCGNANRHVHIDLSRNLCATGFTMAHQAGMTEIIRTDPLTGKKSIEEMPVFHVDGILRILAGPAGDINHDEIRGLIYKLNGGGFNVRSVSLDHWMSVPNIQALKKHGYRVEEISTWKKIDPYETTRAAVYERRIISPEYDILRQELRGLELDPKRPPDKPRVIAPGGATKDVSDSFAGAIYYLAKHHKGGVFIPTSFGEQTKPSPAQNVIWHNGDAAWGDEEGYEDLPDPTGDAGNDQFNQSWII